jgi:hypothetical protein
MGDFLTIKRSDVPTYHSRIFGESGPPRVSVSPQGAIIFSRLAADALGIESNFVAVQFHEETRTLQLFGFREPPANLGEEDCFPVRRPKQNPNRLTINGAALLRWLDYDFRSSGAQVFEATVHPENNCVRFTVPRGSVAQKRRARVSSADGAGVRMEA